MRVPRATRTPRNRLPVGLNSRANAAAPDRNSSGPGRLRPPRPRFDRRVRLLLLPAHPGAARGAAGQPVHAHRGADRAHARVRVRAKAHVPRFLRGRLPHPHLRRLRRPDGPNDRARRRGPDPPVRPAAGHGGQPVHARQGRLRGPGARRRHDGGLPSSLRAPEAARPVHGRLADPLPDRVPHGHGPHGRGARAALAPALITPWAPAVAAVARMLAGPRDAAGDLWACWWGHLVDILFFGNYLPYSKHFHIITSIRTSSS